MIALSDSGSFLRWFGNQSTARSSLSLIAQSFRPCRGTCEHFNIETSEPLYAWKFRERKKQSGRTYPDFDFLATAIIIIPPTKQITPIRITVEFASAPGVLPSTSALP